MEIITPTLLNILWLPGALVLFLLPGWALSHRITSPSIALTAFLGSAAILFQLVLVLHVVGVPLHAGTIGTGLALLSAGLMWRMPPRRFGMAPSAKWALAGGDTWWFIAPALALISIAARALIDPLSGYDNGTRWDYLARLFLAHGSLAGYPPISTADFEYYSWCDGIPPLVPLLNLWIYAATGSVAPALTAMRVIGEVILLGMVVFRYGQLLWGKSGGQAALAALASSTLALWAISMGQETGLTPIALVAMLYFLELHHHQKNRALIFWAGMAAGVGALTREYGLSFPLLGLLILISRRQTRTAGPIFGLTAIGVAAPWFIRNWQITGNPLYPQTMGGLFPGNAIHEETMRYIADYWGLRTSAFSSLYILQALGVLTGVVVTLGAIGAWRGGRRTLPVMAGIVLVVALWLWSIPQTAGGWVYSTRMLSPALALFGVLAGWAGTARSGLRIAVMVICIGGAVDAARRSWLLPDSPFASALTVSFAEWRETHSNLQRIGSNPIWDTLVRLAQGRGIVVDHTAHHALVTMRGGNAIPLFSPLLATTFDDRIPFADALAGLRAAKVKFVTISFKNPMGGRLVRAHPFWVELCLHHKPNAEVQSLGIFDLDQLLPLAPPVPPIQP